MFNWFKKKPKKPDCVYIVIGTGEGARALSYAHSITQAVDNNMLIAQLSTTLRDISNLRKSVQSAIANGSTPIVYLKNIDVIRYKALAVALGLPCIVYFVDSDYKDCSNRDMFNYQQTKLITLIADVLEHRTFGDTYTRITETDEVVL